MEKKLDKVEKKIVENWVNPEIETIKVDNEIIAAIESDCLAKGTKITMADGTLKNIEDIEVNDKVLTFNHEKGCLVASEISYAYKCSAPKCSFTLTFEDGTELSIIGEHDLFNKETLKYVTITDKNATEYIGKHFYSVNKKAYIELKDVVYNTEEVEYYEIYTKNSFNCIANGLLNVADDVDYMLNIYEFNEDLTINVNKLNEDVAKFGIYELTGEYEVTEEFYNEWNVKYVNVIVGKGLATMDSLINNRMNYLNQLHAEEFVKNDLTINSSSATTKNVQ